MAVRKSDLKSIVKECLLEILTEGIGSSSRMVENTQKKNTQPIFSEYSKSSKGPSQQTRRASTQLSDAVKRESGGDRVLESILADTAVSTLPKMLQNESRPSTPVSGGVVEQVVASVDPSEIFGEETTSKWADLAFMSTKIKR